MNTIDQSNNDFNPVTQAELMLFRRQVADAINELKKYADDLFLHRIDPGMDQDLMSALTEVEYGVPPGTLLK